MDRIPGTWDGKSFGSRFHIHKISPNELIDTVSCPGWIEIHCPFKNFHTMSHYYISLLSKPCAF